MSCSDSVERVKFLVKTLRVSVNSESEILRDVYNLEDILSQQVALLSDWVDNFFEKWIFLLIVDTTAIIQMQRLRSTFENYVLKSDWFMFMNFGNCKLIIRNRYVFLTICNLNGLGTGWASAIHVNWSTFIFNKCCNFCLESNCDKFFLENYDSKL